MSIIVALSGGKASAYCADYALNNFPKKDVILYFNDTKWEHPDLYRFLNDLSKYWDKEITYDSDGRSPEELFYDHRALANNRMPFCSRELKSKRLQNFFNDGDTIFFGISIDEPHRAMRILSVYEEVSRKKNKCVNIQFPLISLNADSKTIDNWLTQTGIKQPLLYDLGFTHNNCSGGCVRAGKKQWKTLYEKLPEVYLERERVEREVREFLGKDVHFFKDETLENFRKRIENKELSSYYDTEEENNTECIGICSTMN